MRVLIVEDEPVIALEIESIVQEMLPDAEIVIAASVDQALKACEDDFAMAFLDVDLTDGKSYPLAEALRLKGVPFVFVSGAARADTPESLADAGFVPKPFRHGEIEQAVATLAAGRQGG